MFHLHNARLGRTFLQVFNSSTEFLMYGVHADSAILECIATFRFDAIELSHAITHFPLTLCDIKRRLSSDNDTAQLT